MNKPRLLIIGARGFLGSYAAQAATGAFEVIRADRTRDQSGNIELDLTDAGSVRRAFEETRPDAVLLLSAMADIDRCEAQPEQAFAVNARGVEFIANASVRVDARLLFTSTAAVFDGRKHGYTEEDAVSPVSVYGKTKVSAEHTIAELLPSAVILRFALVLGFARPGGAPAVLDTLLAKWKAGQPVFFSKHESRNAIDAASLSRIIVDLLLNESTCGIYHVGALDSLSRYDLALHIASRAAVPLDLVRVQETPVAGRAPRGDDHFLLTDKLRRLPGFALASCEQVIERCFA